MSGLSSFSNDLMMPLLRGGLTKNGEKAKSTEDVYTDSEAYAAACNMNTTEKAGVTRLQRRNMLAATGAAKSTTAPGTLVDVEKPAPPHAVAKALPAVKPPAGVAVKPPAGVVEKPPAGVAVKPPAVSGGKAAPGVAKDNNEKFMPDGHMLEKVRDCIKYGYTSYRMKDVLFENGAVQVATAVCTKGAFLDRECVVKVNKKGQMQVNIEQYVLTFIWKQNSSISIQYPMSYDSIGIYYVFTSEYAGVDLCETWKKKGAFPIKMVLEMLYEGFEILAQLMQLGVRHGDIKAQNMTFGKKGLTIIDFGTAEINPKEHSFDGSPPYMAMGTHGRKVNHECHDVQALLWTALAVMLPSDEKLPWFDETDHKKILQQKKAFVANLSNDIVPENMSMCTKHVSVFRDLFAAYDKLETSPDRKHYENMRGIIAKAWGGLKLTPKIENATFRDVL